MRPFLPPILAGALAGGDIGVDFDGTGFAFIESPAFLAAVLALAVLSYVVARRRSGTGRAPRQDAPPAARDPVTLALTALAVVLGALLFAASLAAGGVEEWPGYAAGALLALLAALAVGGLLARVGRRLDAGAAALLPVWADAAALALAAVAILFPPAALLGIVALAYLLVAGRRAGGKKYEGLRILR